jgi:hypothetical protein
VLAIGDVACAPDGELRQARKRLEEVSRTRRRARGAEVGLPARAGVALNRREVRGAVRTSKELAILTGRPLRRASRLCSPAAAASLLAAAAKGHERKGAPLGERETVTSVVASSVRAAPKLDGEMLQRGSGPKGTRRALSGALHGFRRASSVVRRWRQEAGSRCPEGSSKSHGRKRHETRPRSRRLRKPLRG